jgi:hypothetical protein
VLCQDFKITVIYAYIPFIPTIYDYSFRLPKALGVFALFFFWFFGFGGIGV